MNNLAWQRRIDACKRRAHGRWVGILGRLGIDPRILSKRNQPCPACGGTDRFQFTDKYGDGNYICRGCGPGDGFALLQGCHGWKFGDALKAVEGVVGRSVGEVRHAQSSVSVQPMRQLAEAMWQAAKPVEAGDAVASYLARRGLVLPTYPKVLRTHSALGFYVREASQKRSKRVHTYAAMLSAVQGRDGRVVTLHRTYLERGAKAPVAECRKLLSAGISGAAVRLFEATDELAVAEGIETALAVHLCTRTPVWAALSAGNMEKLWIPAGVTKVGIYADHDANYTGQASAYALARRLRMRAKGRAPEVSVHVPREVDTDWADVLLQGLSQAA